MYTQVHGQAVQHWPVTLFVGSLSWRVEVHGQAVQHWPVTLFVGSLSRRVDVHGQAVQHWPVTLFVASMSWRVEEWPSLRLRLCERLGLSQTNVDTSA